VKHLLILGIGLLGLTGCATEKKRGETSKVGKIYHDVTSKYNRHFNATVLIDETLAAIDANHIENYAELLPLYTYVDIDNPTPLAEPMDRAIEKTSVAIAIHRPSHWTDDNYFIIGKSQYIKQDYESAEATFRYLIKHYDPLRMLSASTSKSSTRSSNKRLAEKEKAQERKEYEKEREDRIKERKKVVKSRQKKSQRKSEKAEDKKRQERIKERRQQIKDRERSSKNSEPSTKSSSGVTPATSTDKKAPSRNKKRKEPFSDNPELPKIKGNPDNYFLKHKPIHQQAQLWLARTLIERDRFGEAENILRLLERGAGTFAEVLKELHVVRAYSAIRREQLGAAIAPLEKAIETDGNRVKKARYAFVLAQVQERTGDPSGALQSYDKVVSLKPDYEMEFNAALNKLTLQWKTSTMADKKLANELNRWLKDDKNSEYNDKIYFALAQNDLKAGDIEQAIVNLSKSIQSSVSNPIQKAESYYSIANLYFEREEFVKAKNYFDSTLMVMPSADERYFMVESYAKNLTEIAENLESIELTDSLIRIGDLPEKELKKLAQKIKKEMELADAAKKAEQSNMGKDSRVAALNQVSTVPGSNAGSTSFFAYNEKMLKKGIKDFERIWGKITLEDDWRRSNRGSISVLAGGGDVADDVFGGGPISDTEIDEIFKDVPKSEAQLEAAHRTIEDALFELGRLFRSELDDPAKSIESLDRLFHDYPDTDHALDAYYLLYVSHSELNQGSEASKYRQLIEANHGDSEYAKYISNPSYLQNVKTDDQKLESFYQGLYDQYSDGRYQDCLDQMKTGREAFGTTHRLQSKLSLLSALCVGKVQGREPFVNALKETIAKYPDTEEEEKAKEMIRLLGIRFTESTEGIEEINPDAYFALEENDNLHLILVPLLTDSDLNAARIAISNYNTKFHKLDRLNVSTIVLDEDKTPLFVIRRFATREKAMSYYSGVQKNLGEFIADPTSFEIYASSQRNYRKILQLKSIDLYRDFFVSEYLSK